MLIFSIYPILLTAIAFYIQLDDNTLLSSYLLIYILLHIESALMVSFLSSLCNIYPVFSMKSTVMAKKIRLNRKQISINLDLFTPNIKFKGSYLSPRHSICDKKQSKKL